MSKAYEQASEEVFELSRDIIEKYHETLLSAGVTLDILMCVGEAGSPAVTLGGYPCLAVVRAVPLKDRVKGCKDAEIVIDARAWEDLNERRRAALIDHELTHLQPLYLDGVLQTDDIGRPRLKMKKHDYQHGWFVEVARRWGEDSNEVVQARRMMHRDGTLLFPPANE